MPNQIQVIAPYWIAAVQTWVFRQMAPSTRPEIKMGGSFRWVTDWQDDQIPLPDRPEMAPTVCAIAS